MLGHVDSASLTLQTLFNKSFLPECFQNTFGQSACLHTLSLCLFLVCFVCVWTSTWLVSGGLDSARCANFCVQDFDESALHVQCDGMDGLNSFHECRCKNMVLLVLATLRMWACATCLIVLPFHLSCTDCMELLEAAVGVSRCGYRPLQV